MSAFALSSLLAACAGTGVLKPAREAGRHTHFDGPRSAQLEVSPATAAMEKIGPFYYTQVHLNGQPYRFTIETGANHFAISARAAAALGLVIDTVETRFGRSAVVHLAELRIGGARMFDLVARVNPGWTGDFDGILSIPVLRALRTTLDFPNRRIVFENPARVLPEADRVAALPILQREPGDRVVVDVRLGDVAVPAVLDTRSPFDLTAPDSLLSEIRISGEVGSAIRAYGPTLGEFSLRPARVDGVFVLGPHQFPGPVVHFRDRPGVVIGMPILEQFAITFDYAAGVVIIRGSSRRDVTANAPTQSPVTDPARPATDLGFGLIPRRDGSKLVTALIPESSAAQQGLREGDAIVSIGGVPAADISPQVLRGLYTRTTPIVVVVQREGRQLEFRVIPHTRS